MKERKKNLRDVVVGRRTTGRGLSSAVRAAVRESGGSSPEALLLTTVSEAAGSGQARRLLLLSMPSPSACVPLPPRESQPSAQSSSGLVFLHTRLVWERLSAQAARRRVLRRFAALLPEDGAREAFLQAPIQRLHLLEDGSTVFIVVPSRGRGEKGVEGDRESVQDGKCCGGRFRKSHSGISSCCRTREHESTQMCDCHIS